MNMKNMQKIAIVGHGYVGKAVEYGFNTKMVHLQLIDPVLYNNSVADIDPDTDIAFVCVPTPYGKDGEIDASIVMDVVSQIALKTYATIVVKSTVTPNVIGALSEHYEQLVYNPEFLTEKNALADFVNPPMHVFGGNFNVTQAVEYSYKMFSKCSPCPTYHMSAKEASFVKYGINTFLATKVLWFNQFKDLVDTHNSNYETILNAIGSDSRIGFSHAQVPGPDGRRGFGGACFPKDTQAFAHFSDGMMTNLMAAITANNEYRSQYQLDDREKEQNVEFK